MKKTLAILLSLVMVFSLVTTACAENAEAADDAESTTLFTLIVDGVVIPYAEENAIPENGMLVETPRYSVKGYDKDYRAALYVSDGVLSDVSVLAALGDASVDEAVLTNASVTTENNDFTGVIVENSAYEIKDSVFTLNGDTANDCYGLGAAVFAVGASQVKLNHVSVSTKGVRHSSLVVDDLSELYAAHSAFRSEDAVFADESNPTKSFVPWCLGVNGTSRGIDLLGNAHATFYDSVITSEKWGVLAFEDDAIESTNSVAINSTVALTGGLMVDLAEGPTADQVAAMDFYTDHYKEDATMTSDGYPAGYGTLVYADALSVFAGSTIYSPSYGAIISSMGGTVLFTGSDEESLRSIGDVLAASGSAFARKNPDYQVYAVDQVLAEPDYEARNTILYSDRIGVVAYDNELAFMMEEGFDTCKTIIVNDGTTFITGGASMIVKAFPTNIFVDSASLVSGRNILLQVEDCDDPALKFDERVGGLAFTADYYEPTASNGDTRERTRSMEELNDTTMSTSIIDGDHLVTAHYANMETLNGDIFNSSGTSETFNGGAPVLNLYVILDNIGQYSGTITASRGYHSKYTYTYTDEEGKEIGVIASPNFWGEYAAEDWFAANGWTEEDTSWHFLVSEYDDIPCASADNGVIVEVKNGTVWNVTGESFLTKLIVADDSAVNGVMTIDGIEMPIVPGVYEGDIVINAK